MWLKRFQETSHFILILAAGILLLCTENVTISFCRNATSGIYIHTNTSRPRKGMAGQVTQLSYEYLIVS